MSSELWAIVGVVVGALLSLAAQWLLAHIQRRDERVRELAATRRDAYARFVVAVHQAAQATTKFAVNDPSEGVAFEALRSTNIELQDCIGLIGLVSPRETYDAASLLADATLLSFEGGTASETNDARIKDASVAFMRLARKDIGIEVS